MGSVPICLFLSYTAQSNRESIFAGLTSTVRPALGSTDLLRELSVPQVRLELEEIVETEMFLILPGGSGGEGDDAGQCPAASALSEAECAGAVSTCWSPGQRDTDCPSNGLCCVSRNTIYLL